MDAAMGGRRRACRRPLPAGTGFDAGDEELLARYAQTRDPLVLDELAKRFMPFARQLASRYRGGREPFEDLVQVANIGLVNAILRFDPGRGISFASFAAPTILGEIRRHFRDRGWSVRVPRGLQEQVAEVEKAVAELPTKLGRSPSIAEIAERVGITSEDVLEAMEAGHAHYAQGLDASGSEGGEDRPAIADRLGREDPGYETVEYGAAIAPALSELRDRDRLVLHLRFVEDMTQSEIAARIGVSQMHVSRILSAALQRLREEAELLD